MKNKKNLTINILNVFCLIIALAFVVFCFRATVLEGIGTIDIGEEYPDIYPYNLPIYSFQGYSCLGLVPLVAPIMVVFILNGVQNKKTRELILMALLILTLIAYNSGINATWAFLQEVSTEVSPSGRYTTGMIYPVAFTLYTFLAIAFQPYFHSDEQEVK